MTTPQQFGEYLLFRKLTTDGLGETYRAGKIGNQGIERVVLLRMFNGAGLDAETLWRTVADRMGLHRSMQNPHIGDGADVGRVGTTPYVAYEYVSGKNLAELIKQARAKAYQIPTEHALFIMERITFGLSAAFATRHRDQRVQHGFLVPENILLSNEGEVRLIGFESGPGLREFLGAAPLREAFGAYLGPEVQPGTLATSTDDVFSLGSLLYELLTGNRLVHVPDGNYDPLIDDAILHSEDQPLPPSLRALLKSSLAPKEQRIGDVQQWQQAFGRYTNEANYSPTTFNLAFFMHTLFGGEIEQETVDIAREKATQVDVAALAQTQVDEPTPGPSDTVLIPPGQAPEPIPAFEDDSPAASAHYGSSSQKKTNWKVLAPLVLIAIATGLGAYYYMSGARDSAAETADVGMAPPADPTGTFDQGLDDESLLDPSAEGVEGDGTDDALDDAPEISAAGGDAVDVSSVDAPPTPEEVETQINNLVNDRANTLEAKYEDELALLRQQLADAEQAQAEAEAAEAKQAEAKPQAPSGAAAQPANIPAQRPAAGGTASQTPEPKTTAPAQAPAKQPEPEPEPVEKKPEPPKPVSLGDLVEFGPGVSRPEMTQRPSPRYPPSARRLGKQATVKLRVLVNEDGKVVQVDKVGSKAGFGFDEAAISAAERTQWRAATKNGVRVKMWVELKIAFKP